MSLSFSQRSSPTLYQQPPTRQLPTTTTTRNNNDWSSSSPFNFEFASQYQPQTQNSHNPNNLRVHVTELMPLENADSPMNWSYLQQLTPTFNHNATHHQRASSNSSIGSTGPATPYNNNHTSPLVSVPDYYDGLPNPDQSSYIFQKALPTPTHTPLREVFSAGYQTYPHTTNSESDLAAIMALQQKGYQQEPRHEDASVPEDQDREQRPSMPCRNESSEDFEGRRKLDYQGQIPKLDRTISDVFADELYNPNFAVTSAPPQPSPTKTASPSQAQSLIAQRLQAANSQHLSAPPQFPMANIPRDRSPFRQGSPLCPSPNFQMSPLSAARMREQEKAENDAKVLEEQMRKHSPGQDTQQTISPKDALLEYHETEEDANMPLFPQKSPSFRTPKAEPNQTDDNESLHSFGSMATSRRESSSAYSATSQTTAQPSTSFNFAPPSIPGRAQMPQVPQQYPFVSNQNSLPPAVKTENNSDSSQDFHSTLVSMESSSSDYVPEAELKKPNNVSSDGGTYTCTYQGCTLRFDTPAKLQKHKKDGHRQPNSTTISGSSTRGTSEGLTARNSQAGPHRCDRINPSTGKPCNTVFSRPYDLTRHEDTIHNARHQKIRCSLCTEVKTFSRNDALTRHFRVVHPEVELPGKARRRHID